MIISSTTQNTNSVITVIDDLQVTQVGIPSASPDYAQTSPVIPVVDDLQVTQAGIQDFVVSFSLSIFFARENFS